MAVLAIVCVLVSGARPAGATCWIDRELPGTADGLPITSPRVQAIRASAHAINRMLKANAALQGLPEVRLRSTWQITGHPARTTSPYGLHLVLWAHGPQSWSGDCGLIPQADRLEPRAAVVVQANSVNSTLTQLPPPVRDDQLQAFVEPERIGQIGKHPVYRGQWIVLTFDGRLPWVPVTMAEYLAYEERRLSAVAAEADRNIASSRAAAGQFDDNELQKAYEAMKTVDAAEAEKFLAMMKEVKEKTARAVAAAPPVTNAYTGMLADVRALRASLSPAQLQAQAREGYTSRVPRAPIERLPRLVKLDPAFPWDGSNPNRIRLMEVHFSGSGTPYRSLMQAAAESFDWTVLESLMR